MTLRIVKPEDKEPQSPPPPPERPVPGPRFPWLTKRLALWALIAVLVSMGVVVLAFGRHLSQLADAYELSVEFGARKTHVRGTDVTLLEPGHEARCVLSLLDFRELRERTAFLLDATPLAPAPRGAPTFTLSINEPERSVVNSGALAKDQLEPIDAFVINHASACIKRDVGL